MKSIPDINHLTLRKKETKKPKKKKKAHDSCSWEGGRKEGMIRE